MYILDVIPLVKMPKDRSQVLSYFSSSFVPVGSLVSVILGRSKVNALVVSSSSLQNDKISIKKSKFQIKSIDKVISSNPVLSEIEMRIFKWFVGFYGSSLGVSAKIFLPNYLTKKKTKVNISTECPSLSKDKKSCVKHILTSEEKREIFYKNEIKKVLKKQKQVLFLVPDMFSLKYYSKTLKELNPVTLSGDLSPKKQFDIFLSVKNKGIKFLISTRVGLFLDFCDIGLIIFEKEEDSSYKSKDMAPFYNSRDIVLRLSDEFSAPIIFGSNSPSIESYFYVKKSKGQIILDKKSKPPQVVDMKNEIFGGNYSILSYQLQQKLNNILQNKKQAILFLSRRGSETFVFCRDCGHIEKCKNCDLSLIHHKGFKKSLVCHYCGFSKEMVIVCPKCKSHRIKYFGAGTQKAKEEILKIFPGAKIGILDSDITPNLKDQEFVFDMFKKKKLDILIGTQILFKNKDIPKSDLVAILSMDNLFYLPDFKSGERIFQIAKNMSLFSSCDGDFILQTYTPENEVLQIIQKLDYDIFYKNEIEAREIFFYPPFSEVLKLIYKNKDSKKAEKSALLLIKKLKSLNLKDVIFMGPAPAYISKIRGQYIWQIVVKLKPGSKYKKDIFKNVPNDWIVDVNPESLL